MPRRTLKLCKEKECKNVQTTMGYCRLHYLKNCRLIQQKQKKKAAHKLNQYVEHIMKRHPDSYIETIKHDLRHTERFQKRADEFMTDDGFIDTLDEVNLNNEVEKIVHGIKVESSF